ncbi:polysaccharide deacetylase family protein [Phaeacidiphilus oryzae]|uniref:polysaccharide deacetylase family protein n=1 Tax=Phaeacidiphilus oryzae TaxID=348818 RepID=UPI00055A6341|nr:polysaccharide deacetylase family protein [Phaeacidiphilus oryzae]
MVTTPRRTLLRAAALAPAALTTLAACDSGGQSDQSSHESVTARRTASASPASAPASPTPAAGEDALPFHLHTGPRTTHAVALTFHGQGDPAVATALLAEAERAGARLTVLAVGSWLDAQPQMAHRILSGGHELGNHTQHHIDISSLPAPRAYAEIADCASRLHRLTGSIGRWFRPSQATDCTTTVAAQAARVGYRHCLGYDVDSLDYTDPGPDAVVRTVLQKARPGSIVSMHFGHSGTVTALPRILDGLHQRGLRAVTTTELFK